MQLRSGALPASEMAKKRFTYTLISSRSEILITVLEFKKIPGYTAVEELVVCR